MEQDSAPAEIEVVGAFDQDVTDVSIRHPVPGWDVVGIKTLSSVEQIRQYLVSLPDEFLISTVRHVQYCDLRDGSLHQMAGYATVRRIVEPPEPVPNGEVEMLPRLDEETRAQYAMGWRELPEPKVTNDPCPRCSGRGVCTYCRGSGSAVPN